MFEHSIKVPQLYKTATKIAKDHADSRVSIKNLIYKANHPNKKAIYALLVNTLKHSTDLDYLLEKTELLRDKRFDPWLARILITELLWGKKHLASESKPIKAVLALEPQLKAYIKDRSKALERNVQVHKPRYVRVNTLVTTTGDVINQLRNDGWIFIRNTFNQSYEQFLKNITNLHLGEFTVDLHIPDLLVFAKRTELYGTRMYQNSEIALQDKASCLAAYLLDPKPGSCVLDMCAAPGMKTTHLAALMGNKGKIYAVEIRQDRYETMKRMIANLRANCVEAINRDVTTLTEKECPNVEYILVDPSCSGSGITDRINNGEEVVDPKRLEKLAGFQAVILRHALNNFPNAKRVVYSTCSLSPEENEMVVRDVLETCKDFKLVDLRKVMNKKWINYGSTTFGEIGNRCLYAKPEIDQTNGFFVAMFERLQTNEHNEFFNRELFKAIKEKTKDKKQKKSSNDLETNGENIKKLKKKKKSSNNLENNGEKIKKHIKKKKSVDNNVAETSKTNVVKRKRKKRSIAAQQTNGDKALNKSNDGSPEKCKKKKKSVHEVVDNQLEINGNVTKSKTVAKKCKKKKQPIQANYENQQQTNDDEALNKSHDKNTKNRKRKRSIEQINENQINGEISKKNKKKPKIAGEESTINKEKTVKSTGNESSKKRAKKRKL